MVGKRTWGGSLHQTFRLFPAAKPDLEVFLGAEGATREEVLGRLPYEPARAGGRGNGAPDSKRYRDGRQTYQQAGLLYEAEDRRLVITDLGKATARWIGKLQAKNSVVLGRHAAYALATCQLRHPTRAGMAYAPDLEVFPFSFIWRAMLALDDKIRSPELNRVLFKVTNEDDLQQAIALIRQCRGQGLDDDALGSETETGDSKNDRLIPWISLASFGFLLFADKREGGGEWYTIRPTAKELLREAAQIRRKHREFTTVADYVEHISDAACLPADVRWPIS